MKEKYLSKNFRLDLVVSQLTRPAEGRVGVLGQSARAGREQHGVEQRCPACTPLWSPVGWCTWPCLVRAKQKEKQGLWQYFPKLGEV